MINKSFNSFRCAASYDIVTQRNSIATGHNISLVIFNLKNWVKIFQIVIYIDGKAFVAHVFMIRSVTRDNLGGRNKNKKKNP